jgi:serine/threonine protein phosphatase PrpC
VAGRASIVGAAETNVGKVRDHNEDAHFIDPEAGIFVVCDGMGGHAAGEVASAIAVATVRERWSSDQTLQIADRWLAKGTPDAHRALLAAVTDGVIAAHEAILEEANVDRTKSGMGTTIVGGMIVGGEMVFAHCGDSRAYLVRDGIAMQLTEDHTLLARLLAAGVDVDTDGEGSRFKSMLTNALGIGHECKASTFVVPLADGDRFLLCSDGITEYVKEHEVGEVLGKAASPARAAQKLVEMALDRGGGDNATALVVRVLEAGETSRPAEHLRRDNEAINACPLWAKTNPQQRLRALRIALPRDHAAGEKVPAHTLGDRVAWIIIDGSLEQDGELRGPGSLIYPESLLADRPLPDKDGLAIAKTDVRALALRADDFRELCEEDSELAEHLLASLGDEIGRRGAPKKIVVGTAADWRGTTDPGGHKAVEPAGELPPLTSFEPMSLRPTPEPPALPRASTEPPELPAIPTPDLSRTKTENLRPQKKKEKGKDEPDFAHASTEVGRDPPAETEPERAPADGGRPRTNTDLGATPLPRSPAPANPDANPNRSRPRGTTPPSERSLIATPAETGAALDAAMARISLDDRWAELPDEDSEEQQRATVPVAKPSESELEAEIVVEAEPPPAPAPAPMKNAALSEPEISISALEDDGHPAATETVVESDSAKIVEVVQDTSSQTITMTIEEPPEPEIEIVRKTD